eukprot:jgi/Picsp_1/5838/NSC_03197-R1_sulfotransferase
MKQHKKRLSLLVKFANLFVAISCVAVFIGYGNTLSNAVHGNDSQKVYQNESRTVSETLDGPKKSFVSQERNYHSSGDRKSGVKQTEDVKKEEARRKDITSGGSNTHGEGSSRKPPHLSKRETDSRGEDYVPVGKGNYVKTATIKKKEEETRPLVNTTTDGREFLRAIEACQDLVCLKEAHEKYPRPPGMYNYPHFIIAGFQKAATTSLKKYLDKHSQSAPPKVKEPNFFTDNCNEKPPEECPAADTRRYINRILNKKAYLESNGTLATYEASTHIVRAGLNLAPKLAKLFPWVKIVIMLREPISRAASMLIHNKDVSDLGCLARKEISYCLLHHSQLTEMTPGKYEPLTYTEAMKYWLDAFPKEQILVIQYENLTSEEGEAGELLRAKGFLGLDLNKPKRGLELSNSRRFRINPEGWAIKKHQYQQLLQLVKPDVRSMLNLLYEREIIDDKDGWFSRWERIDSDHRIFFVGIRYEPSTWSELQSTIGIGTLEALRSLGRRPEDLEMYRRFKETKILSSWVSIHDYLMCQVFGCPWAVDSAAGDKKRHVEPKDFRETRRSVLRENDFPYYMEGGIEHFILWSTSPMEKEDIESYIAREMPGFEYLWFVNPVELRSVLDVRMPLLVVAFMARPYSKKKKTPGEFLTIYP